jgi:hypothetical protein
MSIQYLKELKARIETSYSVVDDDSIYHINGIIPLLEYESQLLAIVDLLIRQYEADNELRVKIEEADKAARDVKGANEDYAQYLTDNRSELIQKSIFQDAAHSMSAIGMLAPFTESLFFHLFQGLKENVYAILNVVPNSKRLERTGKKAWNCHYFFEENKFEKNLVLGIIQMNSELGVSRYMPNRLEISLMVLFSFRNFMFHCGFEWPIREREKFQAKIQEENWPEEWYSFSTTNDKPWIYYLSNDFINNYVELIVETLIGVSKYIEMLIEFNENKCPTKH